MTIKRSKRAGINYDQLPITLKAWLKQPGASVTPTESEFIECVRSFAAEGVGYGWMQSVIEMEWADVCARQHLPNGAWGPDYYTRRIRELEAEVMRLQRGQS